jgi:hypothetical protein
MTLAVGAFGPVNDPSLAEYGNQITVIGGFAPATHGIYNTPFSPIP